MGRASNQEKVWGRQGLMTDLQNQPGTQEASLWCQPEMSCRFEGCARSERAGEGCLAAQLAVLKEGCAALRGRGWDVHVKRPEDSVTYLVYRGPHWHLRILWLTGVWLHKCQRSYTLRDVVRCPLPGRKQVVSPLPYSCN